MLAALAVLIGLGVWQLQRLHWKEGLIARIETRTKGDPITLKQAIAMAREGRDPSYYRVRVDGRFHHAKERYLYAVSEGRVGWHVITPLETADGEMVLVDRGFVPDRAERPVLARPRAGRERGRRHRHRAGRPRPKTCSPPTTSPAANRWFWRDLQGMARSIFPGGAIRGGAVLPRGREERASPAAGRKAARPGSKSPTTICNMPSPGFCWPPACWSSMASTCEAFTAARPGPSCCGRPRRPLGSPRENPLFLPEEARREICLNAR